MLTLFHRNILNLLKISCNLKRNNLYLIKEKKRKRKEYSRIVSERQTGKGNNQFGTMWITNETLKENKKILKDELIPNGWKKGRTNYKL